MSTPMPRPRVVEVTQERCPTGSLDGVDRTHHLVPMATGRRDAWGTPVRVHTCIYCLKTASELATIYDAPQPPAHATNHFGVPR